MVAVWTRANHQQNARVRATAARLSQPGRKGSQQTEKGAMPSRAASHWLLSSHPQSLLAASRARAPSTLPPRPVALGPLTEAQPMGEPGGGAGGAGRAHAGPKVNRVERVRGARTAAARGGVAELTEEPAFLQPGKAAACRPAATLSTPGSVLTCSSDNAA